METLKHKVFDAYYIVRLSPFFIIYSRNNKTQGQKFDTISLKLKSLKFFPKECIRTLSQKIGELERKI